MRNKHYLEKRIKASGYKQKWLADKCGISEVLLSYYLNGTRPMSERVESILKEYV